MSKIVAYLAFNGNCKEAMTFYQRCLGGQLKIQTVGESEKGELFPDSMKKYVVHADLENDHLFLKGTDLTDQKLFRGNSVSLLLDCSSSRDLHHYYQQLSDGGTATYPISKTPTGSLFGGLTDRYGNQWLFICNRNNQEL